MKDRRPTDGTRPAIRAEWAKRELSLDNDDPRSCGGLLSSDARHWQEAIASELASITANGTWEIVSKVPVGRNPIGCKWIFKRKLNPDGLISRYKARLVAKGYSQIYGLDYDETYAPVAKFTSIRAILMIKAILDIEIYQIDIKTTFLHSNLDEKIYMEIPEGIEMNEVTYKLIKSLYSLKQSPWQWNLKLHQFLIGIRFDKLKTNHSIYIRKQTLFLQLLWYM